MKGKVLAAGLSSAAVAVAVVAAIGIGGRGTQQPRSWRSGPATTVAVTRQTLVESVSLAGEVGYGPAVPLASAAGGTVTSLPEEGSTVRRGDALLHADELPVVLLYGPLPMYRPLAEGVKGGDVEQFERNLSALGYHGFTVDEEFSASTTSAVKRWQKDLGLPETGSVERERVVYAPGAIRVAQRLVRVGASATGDVLSYTGSVCMVTVPAGAGEAAWAVKGTAVTVKLPDGKEVAGKVTGVADTAPAADGARPAQDGSESAQTVEVHIGIADQKALGRLEKGRVTVRYVARERKDVLTVPVSALLALAEGGYGLEVLTEAEPAIVPVEAGMFADGRVEVSGDGIAEGAKVGVPE